MKKLLVIGDTDIDIFLTIPKIPTWDEGILATGSAFLPGGKGANTAVQLFSLGSPASLLSCIGDDSFGKKSLEWIQKLHMDNRYICIEPGVPTTFCVMLLDPSGEKALIVAPSIHIYPPLEVIDTYKGILSEFDHVHVIGLQPHAVLPIAMQAKGRGLQLSVDLDSASQGLEASRALIGASDILFMNRQGAYNLFPDKSIRESLVDLYAMGPSQVVCTLGAEGIILYNGTVFVESSGFHIHPIDTTGSGDACIAAYLHGRLNEGMEDERLLAYANAAGALVAMYKGGQGILLDNQVMEQFIQAQHKDTIMDTANIYFEGTSGQKINFYEPYDAYGYFCNLSDHPIVFDGLTWPSVEHCYQAQKHADLAYRERIRHAATCREAIALGRNEASGSYRKDEWMDIRLDVMRQVVFAKFSQHIDLKEKLLATGDAYLSEHTDNDFFWGDGLNGTGKNWLGRIIMEVREQLR